MFQRLSTLARTGLASLALFSCASHPTALQAQVYEPEQAREDLERLYTGLQSAEAGLFASTDKAVFDRRYQELHDSFTAPISAPELFREFQKFAALARHGHTRIEGLSPDWADFYAGGGKVFPLGFSVHQGDVIVSSAPDASGILPGDRILAIDGKTNAAWLDEITQYVSAETPALAHSILKQGEFYYVWLAYGERPEFVVTIDRDGVESRVVVDAITVDAISENAQLEKGFELPGREAKKLNDELGYLRPGPFYDYEAGTSGNPYNAEGLARYTTFIDEAFQSFIDEGVEDLILDLRDNPGGDSSFSDPVVAWFATEPFRFASEFRIRVSNETTASNQARLDASAPGEGGVSKTFADLFANAENGDMVLFDIPMTQPREKGRFEGNVHVLVNRFSYSNAVTVAAMIQDYGFGTLYGEATRDMATTYGAMEHFRLPHTEFKVGYPKAHIVRPNGERRSHPVTPDISFQIPAVRGSEDVALGQLIHHIGKEK